MQRAGATPTHQRARSRDQHSACKASLLSLNIISLIILIYLFRLHLTLIFKKSVTLYSNITPVTDRQTEIHIDRETDSYKDKQTERKTGI